MTGFELVKCQLCIAMFITTPLVSCSFGPAISLEQAAEACSWLVTDSQCCFASEWSGADQKAVVPGS